MTDIGHNRGPELEIFPLRMGGSFSAMHLPAAYVNKLKSLDLPNECCKRVEEEGHTAQWFASASAGKQENGDYVPDLIIITCGKCKREHRRWFLGGGVRVVTEVR